MKLKNIIVVIVAVALAIMIFYSFQGKDTGKGYSEEIKKEREAKNLFMRSNEESPFGADKNTFKELNYYPIDVTYRVSAKLEVIRNRKMIALPTSDGLEKKYLEYGYAEFELGGQTNKLLILEIMEEAQYKGTLFLAFADATSANETYGAGRYLDLKKVPGASSITLDFNQAYNPYCAYSENYSCPFPPAGNVLKVAIRAGEKKYHN